MKYTLGSKQRGQTLVETMFVLAVLALIIAVAGKFYSSTRFNAQVNNAVQDVNYQLGAMANFALGAQPTNAYQGQNLNTALQSAGSIPNNMQSPWGTSYENYMWKGGYSEVVITDIESTACQGVFNVMRNQLAANNSGTTVGSVSGTSSASSSSGHTVVDVSEVAYASSVGATGNVYGSNNCNLIFSTTTYKAPST